MAVSAPESGRDGLYLALSSHLQRDGGGARGTLHILPSGHDRDDGGGGGNRGGQAQQQRRDDGGDDGGLRANHV